jgi:alpha-L-fucosidase
MDWETPATINDTWGYKKDDHNWKPGQELIRRLVDVASKGGNYLPNVGPTAEGVIPDPSVERLLAIGRWLETNGESVYGTRPGPLQGLGWCRTTTRPGRVYLHVFDWPADGDLRLPGLAAARARLLADGSPLPIETAGGGRSVHQPSTINHQPSVAAVTRLILPAAPPSTTIR